MRNRANPTVFALILILTALAVVIVWPSNPDRYLPSFIPWPKGHGLTIGGADRETMRLGLDLKGGSYILLEGDTSALPRQQCGRRHEGRPEHHRAPGSTPSVSPSLRFSGRAPTVWPFQLPGISQQDAKDLIGRTALLEFREPKRDGSGDIVSRLSRKEVFHRSGRHGPGPEWRPTRALPCERRRP